MYVPQNCNVEMPGKSKMLRKSSLDVSGLFSYHLGEERAEREHFLFTLLCFGLLEVRGSHMRDGVATWLGYVLHAL